MGYFSLSNCYEEHFTEKLPSIWLVQQILNLLSIVEDFKKRSRLSSKKSISKKFHHFIFILQQNCQLFPMLKNSYFFSKGTHFPTFSGIIAILFAFFGTFASTYLQKFSSLHWRSRAIDKKKH